MACMCALFCVVSKATDAPDLFIVSNSLLCYMTINILGWGNCVGARSIIATHNSPSKGKGRGVRFDSRSLITVLE